MKNTSNKILTVIVHTIAVILSVLFILTALAALIFINVERRAFKPATYERGLREQNFYQQFPTLLGDLLAKNIGNSAPGFTQHMTAKQWTVLIEALLPEPQLRAMTEETIAQVFAYLNGETQTPQISFVSFKQNLSGPAGVNAVLTIIQSQPDCTIEQIAKVLTSFGQELCNPPQEILDLLRPVIQAQLQATAAAIPDQVSILTKIGSNASLQSGLKILRAVRLAMRLSPLLPLALLLLITLLVVRSLKGWLAWWGWPFLLTGLPGMLIGLAGAPLFRLTVEGMLSKRTTTLTIPPEVAASLRAVVDAALHEMLKPVAWESLALFIVGLAMIVVSFYLTRREKRKVAASEATTQIF